MPTARFDEPAGLSISTPTRTRATTPSLPCRWPDRKPWSKVTWTASDSGCSPAVLPPRPIQSTPEIFRQITEGMFCKEIHVRNHHYHHQRQRSAKVSVHPPRGHRRGIRHHRREPGLHDRPEVLRRQEGRARGSPGEGAGAPARARSSRGWPVRCLRTGATEEAGGFRRIGFASGKGTSVPPQESDRRTRSRSTAAGHSCEAARRRSKAAPTGAERGNEMGFAKVQLMGNLGKD